MNRCDNRHLLQGKEVMKMSIMIIVNGGVPYLTVQGETAGAFLKQAEKKQYY